MKISFTTVDGVATRYLHAGEGGGDALFLLHGIGMSGDLFLRNIEPLAGQGRTVIAPDLLGHGFTDAVDFGTVPPALAMARHVLGLAEALGLGRCAMAGSSFGALVAALAQREAPERVSRLVLIGSGSVFHPAEEQKATLAAAAANGTRAMRELTRESCRRRMANIVHDAASVPEEILLVQLTAYARADRLAAYEATVARSIATMEKPEARVYERLEALPGPSLVIAGKDDIRARWPAHVEGVGRMRRARLELYEACGHMPFLEHAPRFNADVAGFLAEGGDL